MAANAIMQSGWLQSRSLHLKQWKWRWLALTGESLIVCKKEGLAHAKRSIPLSDGSIVKVRSADVDTHKSHSFCIQTHGVAHFLLAASADEQRSWLESISRLTDCSRSQSEDSSPKSSTPTTFMSTTSTSDRSSSMSKWASTSGSSSAPTSASSSASSFSSRWSERLVGSKSSGPSSAAPTAGEHAGHTDIEVLVDVERMLAGAEAIASGGQLEVPRSEAATAVARILESAEDLSERSRAAKAMGALASSSQDVAAATLPLALVTQKNADVRAAVALAIGAAGEVVMGSGGRSVLLRAAADANAKVRAAAEQALWMPGWLEVIE